MAVSNPCHASSSTAAFLSMSFAAAKISPTIRDVVLQAPRRVGLTKASFSFVFATCSGANSRVFCRPAFEKSCFSTCLSVVEISSPLSRNTFYQNDNEQNNSALTPEHHKFVRTNTYTYPRTHEALQQRLGA